MTNTELKHTALYEQHRALGARMIDFNGWEMPVQYSGILQEHEAVRTRAGLFDVSHMGVFQVEGPDALSFLQYLVPNNVGRLTFMQVLYTQLCTPAGTTLDDLLIYNIGIQRYLLVVNAATTAQDLAWIRSQAAQYQQVTISDQSESTALLALQGPAAQAILQPYMDIPLTEIAYYHCSIGDFSGVSCLISRTGYTGEDGFELYCEPTDAVKLWQDILSAGQLYGLLPAGLGARDTLRLEAGYCLYGHELDQTTNPLEANLGWSVKLNKGNFIGQAALQQLKTEGLKRRLVGIELLDRGIPRAGYALYDGEQQLGMLTSGAPGPTVKKNIGLGYVPTAYAKPGQALQIEIRGKKLAAQVVALPFYKRPQ